MQKRNIFRITVGKDGAGKLDIQILCYEERSIYVRALTGKEEYAGLAQEEPPGRCQRRRSGLPANLTIHHSLLDYFVKGVSEL